MNKTLLAPSLLSCDFSNLGEAINKIENNFGEYLHSIEKQVVFPDAINNKIKLSIK